MVPGVSPAFYERCERWASAEVERCLEELPPEVRAAADEVTVVLRPHGDGLERDLLGLFTGLPIHEHASSSDPAVPQIELFLETIWDFVGQSPAGFVDEVRVTLLHELGHYLGWDEDDLAARGLE